MIKLIAADMDGTLYDNEKNFPPNFWQMFDELKKQGVYFCAASGRTYPTLLSNFEKRRGDMLYICDNGALIARGEKVLYASVIEKRLVHEIVKECSQIPDIHLAVSGAHGTYVTDYSKKPWHKKIIGQCFTALNVVESLENIDDDIIQIAVCDEQGPANNSCPKLQKLFGEELEVLVSGESWMDIMNKGISKGKALLKLCEILGIEKKETMSFGDYDNDIELIKNAGQGYVMQNAPEYMRKYSPLTAPPNTEYGVAKIIYREILHKEYGY